MLEINTVAHVLCAIAAYLFWFRKPYDAKQPVIVDFDWVPTMAALWSMKLDLNNRDDTSSQRSFYAHDAPAFERFLCNRALEEREIAKRQQLQETAGDISPLISVANLTNIGRRLADCEISTLENGNTWSRRYWSGFSTRTSSQAAKPDQTKYVGMENRYYK